MRNRIIVSITFVLCFATCALLHAEVTFKVLCTVGSVEIQTTAKNSWERLITGSTITQSAHVKLGTKSYASMISSNGKAIELLKADTYAMKDYGAAVTDQKTAESLSILGSFLAETITQSTVPHQHIGAIYRNAHLNVVFPFDTKILDSDVQLLWKSASTHDVVYVLTLRNLLNVIFLKVETKDTLWKGSLQSIKNAKRGECIYWSVEVKGNETDQVHPYCLYWLSDKEVIDIRAREALLRSQARGDLHPERSPLSAVILAAWYEREGLFSEALKFYDQALTLQPEAEDYKKARESMLGRVGAY